MKRPRFKAEQYWQTRNGLLAKILDYHWVEDVNQDCGHASIGAAIHFAFRCDGTVFECKEMDLVKRVK